MAASAAPAALARGRAAERPESNAHASDVSAALYGHEGDRDGGGEDYGEDDEDDDGDDDDDDDDYYLDRRRDNADSRREPGKLYPAGAAPLKPGRASPAAREANGAAPYSAVITAAQGASLVAVNVDTGAPSDVLDLSLTAQVMFARSVRRRANGHYKRKANKGKVVWIILTILVFMSLIGAGISIYLPNLRSDMPNAGFSYQQWSSLAVVVSFFVVLFFVIKLSLLVRWCFYWLAIAVVILVIINGGNLAPQPSESTTSDENPVTMWVRVIDKNNLPTIAVVVVLIVVEFATLFATMIQRWLYPRFVSRCSPDTAIKWCHVRPVFSQPGTFQYKIWDWWSMSLDTRTFSYTGSVNSAGVPHGYGEWYDDANSGEVTKGYWRYGIPVAPYKAREFGSGDSFNAVKIGFATSSRLGMDEYSPLPQFDLRGVRYGVASVECSVSGKFFAELPEVTVTSEPAYREDILARLGEDSETGRTCRPMDVLLDDMDNREFGGYGSCPSPMSRLSAGAANDRQSSGQANLQGTFLERVTSLTRLRRQVTYQSLTSRPLPEAAGAEQSEPCAPPRRLVISIDPVHQVPVVEGFRPVGDPRNSVAGSEASEAGRLRVETASWRPPTAVVRAVRTEDGVGLTVDGYEPDPEADHCYTNSRRRSGRIKEETLAAKEALIFIHGYNCSVSAALKRFGQLLSLGDFPPHIKPFVFAWPPGTTLTYFQALKSAEETLILDAFVQLIQDLSRSGIRRVHILSHSAGCRLAVSFAKVFGDLFQTIMHDGPLGDHVRSSTGVGLGPSTVPMAKLCSFTLINPDVSLDKFLDVDYLLIRRHCDLITSYVDQHDGALFWAELFSREKSLGLHPNLIYTVLAKRRPSGRVPSGPPGSVGRHSKRTIKSAVDGSSTPSVPPAAGSSSPSPREDQAAAEAAVEDTLEAAAGFRGDSTTTFGAYEMTPSPSSELYLPFRKPKSRDSRSRKRRLLMRSRFEGLPLASPAALTPSAVGCGAAAGAAPSAAEPRGGRRGRKAMRRKKEESRLEEEEMVELRRLRKFLREREKYTLEVTDWGAFDVEGRRSAKSLIYPDMDTVDTSLLDVNIHSIRHNYFNLNRLLVDDLLDIIVHKKRANERTARLSTSVVGGLVYQFLCAPSYVVNP